MLATANAIDQIFSYYPNEVFWSEYKCLATTDRPCSKSRLG